MLENIIINLLFFVSTFFIVGFLYRMYIIKKLKKDKNNFPSEVMYILNVYKLDKDKIDISKLLNIIIVVNTLMLTIIALIASFGDGYGQSLLIGLLLFFPLIFLIYHIIGKCFQRESNNKRKKKTKIKSKIKSINKLSKREDD